MPTRIGDDSFGALAITVAAATAHFAFVLIAAAKHRVVHALIGILVPGGLAGYAAQRLGKPRSLSGRSASTGSAARTSRREPSTGTTADVPVPKR